MSITKFNYWDSTLNKYVDICNNFSRIDIVPGYVNSGFKSNFYYEV